MIKYNNRKVLPKQAAIEVTLTSMMEFGATTDEFEMYQAMTDYEKKRFATEYTRLYNSLAKKLDADPVEFRDIANWRIR